MRPRKGYHLHVLLYLPKINTESSAVANHRFFSQQEKYTVQYVIMKPSTVCVEKKIHPLRKRIFICHLRKLTLCTYFFGPPSAFEIESESPVFHWSHLSVFLRFETVHLCLMFFSPCFHFCLVCYSLSFLLRTVSFLHTLIQVTEDCRQLICSLSSIQPAACSSVAHIGSETAAITLRRVLMKPFCQTSTEENKLLASLFLPSR